MSVTYNTIVATAIEAEFKGRIKKAADQALVQGVGTAQSLVRVDTSNLKNSIPRESKVEEMADGVGITLAAKATGKDGKDYSLPQEYGTYKMSAQPYIRPAGHEMVNSLPGLIKSNIR